jgi:hypothetical protein
MADSERSGIGGGMSLSKKGSKVRYDATDDDKGAAQPIQTESRSEELIDEPGVANACIELYRDIEKAFQDQWERANSIMDYWDIYNCQLSQNQFYSGNSKIFVPIVHDAINARVTRFVNQIFPVSGKHVEVSASEQTPQALMSLLEFYIRKTKLRTRILPAMLRNGDVEGQYSLLVGWTRNERYVAMRVPTVPTIDALKIEGEEEFDDIQEENIIHQYPSVEVIADPDMVVLPANAMSVEAAVASGGAVAVVRRWSKAKINQLMRDEEISEEFGESLLERMASKADQQYPDKPKAMADAAGIKVERGKTFAQVYLVYTMLKVKGERRICRIYFGGATSAGEDAISVRRNPYWCDKVPILSAPVEQLEGVFKGQSQVKYIDTMQYAANDAINEGMDAAAYALLPIIMTDPVKNPRTGSMVLNVAAVWETSPNDTKFAQFPPLWKDAFAIVQSAKDQVFQTLGVNPSMMPHQATAPGKKPNQAQIANEQQVDILTTANVVTGVEGEILSPLLEWFVALDHQFRDRDITIRAFGKMGVEAAMEEIKPIQMNRRFEFRWFGVEAARNAQQMQQQMAGLNVVRSLPPTAYPGYELQLAPVISQFIENLFGPRMASQIFVDVKEKLTLNAEFENQLLAEGHDLMAHPMDDDAQHVKAHAQLMQQKGDLTGTIRTHMLRHQMQMQAKQQAMMQQQQAMMQPKGAPGPGGGQPRPGGAPAGMRAQGPPGQIHQDRMPNAMPRAARG